MGIAKTKYEIKRVDTNLDPLTGEPGAHPIGVGTGAAGGGITGALIGGAVGGPVGAGIGAIVGAVGGGIAGKEIAEAIDPTAEHEYWRIEFLRRPYYIPGLLYEEFGPAYQYGWESYSTFGTKGKTFDEIEADLRRDWENRRGKSKLSWEKAKEATRDAWSRIEKSCGCE